LRDRLRGRWNPRRRSHEVGNYDDVIFIKDTSNDEDEETSHQRLQLHSWFNRARMPHILVIKKPSSLEASLPVPPRKPRNVARKRVMKKLKLSEATR
jgi:hypothetical protein